jgi:hypothetical protein
MSAWHNGALRTMKANYYVQQKDLRVIRPLVLLSHYSYSHHMHIPASVSSCIRNLCIRIRATLRLASMCPFASQKATRSGI